MKELAQPRSIVQWPEQFRPWCQVLLHQQCWCWGQDIRHPAGNLLLTYGFQRVRPPAGNQGGTRYQLRLSARSTVTLWGFGIYYARCGRGGVYLNRYECMPRFCHMAGFLENVWTKDAPPLSCSTQCANFDDPDVNYLATKALEWVGRYEEWVLERFGVDYRRTVLKEWHEAALLPERVPQEWRGLAELARRRPRRRIGSVA